MTRGGFLAATIFLAASLARTWALASSVILLLATMCLRVVLCEESLFSFRASAIMTWQGGWAGFTAGFLALGALLAGAAAASVMVVAVVDASVMLVSVGAAGFCGILGCLGLCV